MDPLLGLRSVSKRQSKQERSASGRQHQTYFQLDREASLARGVVELGILQHVGVEELVVERLLDRNASRLRRRRSLLQVQLFALVHLLLQLREEVDELFRDLQAHPEVARHLPVDEVVGGLLAVADELPAVAADQLGILLGVVVALVVVGSEHRAEDLRPLALPEQTRVAAELVGPETEVQDVLDGRRVVGLQHTLLEIPAGLLKWLRGGGGIVIRVRLADAQVPDVRADLLHVDGFLPVLANAEVGLHEELERLVVIGGVVEGSFGFPVAVDVFRPVAGLGGLRR